MAHHRADTDALSRAGWIRDLARGDLVLVNLNEEHAIRAPERNGAATCGLTVQPRTIREISETLAIHVVHAGADAWLACLLRLGAAQNYLVIYRYCYTVVSP